MAAGLNEISVALLGRRDHPTDALRDYCRYLGGALGRREIQLQLAEVRWDGEGWIRASKRLWKESKAWRGRVVLLQYTALGWSRRGIPVGAIVALKILRRRGARVGIVFHDANPFRETRIVDRCRRWLQRRVMRAAYQAAEKSFFTIPLEKINWLPSNRSKARFVPIGANIPACDDALEKPTGGPSAPKTIAVFSVWTGAGLAWQVSEISHAVSRAAEKIPGLQLSVFGRGSNEAHQSLEAALRGKPLTLSVLGIVPDEEVAHQLSIADVLLFTRGGVAGTRGSVLAAIACGVPVVAYEGSETAFPLTEAGVVLVPWPDRDALAAALIRVLTDDQLSCELRERNRRAQSAYFSWDKIAEQFAAEFSL